MSRIHVGGQRGQQTSAWFEVCELRLKDGCQALSHIRARFGQYFLQLRGHFFRGPQIEGADDGIFRRE